MADDETQTEDPPTGDPSTTGSDGAGTEEATDKADGHDTGSGDGGAPAQAKENSEGFDLDAAEGRIQEVEEAIEEGRRALDDVQQDVEPSPDGPPVARGDGAANAPPG